MKLKEKRNIYFRFNFVPMKRGRSEELPLRYYSEANFTYQLPFQATYFIGRWNPSIQYSEVLRPALMGMLVFVMATLVTPATLIINPRYEIELQDWG